MDVHRVGLGPARCGQSLKTRQEIDFSEILKGRQAAVSGASRQARNSEPTGICEPGIQTRNPSSLVSLGKVTQQNPNVSSLLIRHPVYKQDCWNILHIEANRSKPYTRIRPGTEIYLDPKTREIVWGKMLQVPDASRPVAKSQPTQPAHQQATPAAGDCLSERLLEAVKPLFGKPYAEINCYELLVKGLTHMGVRYHGPGGLGRKLIGMAKEHGLPMNAYFNGEGLIKASGSPVYSKTLFQVRSPERQASQLLKEIEPYLEKGQILSFSIHSRGHTGIVSRAQDTWTYINSGNMDNALTRDGPDKGVGEESLEAEIRDWFELASSRGESLRITLGRLSEQQLAGYYEPSSTKTEKA